MMPTDLHPKNVFAKVLSRFLLFFPIVQILQINNYKYGLSENPVLFRVIYSTEMCTFYFRSFVKKSKRKIDRFLSLAD